MSREIIGVRTKVEFSNVLATAVIPTAISIANPGVMTLPLSHALVDGDVILAAITDGMEELDGQVARIDNSTTTSAELERVSTLLMAPFVAGTVQKVTSWYTLSKVVDIVAEDSAPPNIPTTSLDNKLFESGVPGLIAVSTGTMTMLDQPTSAAIDAYRAAAAASSVLAFRVTHNNGMRRYFGALVGGGYGFGVTLGQASQQKLFFQFRARPVTYDAP